MNCNTDLIKEDNKRNLELLQGYYKVFRSYFSVIKEYKESTSRCNFDGKIRTCNNLRKAWINLFSGRSFEIQNKIQSLDDCLQYLISEMAKNELEVIIDFEI